MSPEAWTGAPLGRVRDGDTIRLRIDTARLEGSIDVVSTNASELAARAVHPDLKPDPRVPADTRLCAALQGASGGIWSRCVYDVDRISRLLELGRAAGWPRRAHIAKGVSCANAHNAHCSARTRRFPPQ